MEMKEYYSLSLEETIAASILRTYTEACQISMLEIGKRFLISRENEVQIDGDSLIDLMIEARDYMLANIKVGWIDNTNMDRKDIEKFIYPVINAVLGIDFISLVSQMSPEFVEYLCEYAEQ